ncbi:hypothetical protein GCM10023185_18120 [Hymenobacter saemangeumensis]|uniref:receptor protein-tyrosine kinase n=1 Tax=Hymenobacter saemangeumensis TaxID=1084522 RepID=A0ABP8IBK5_9BACT
MGLAGASLATVKAQTTPGVGIGTSTPNSSALLEVNSTTKGLLPPRMSQTQRDAINPAATAAGLTVYNTSTGKLNVWNGTSWTEPISTTEQPLTSPTVTFTYTGGPQTYNVPAGVTRLAVDALGAEGGRPSFIAAPPGRGARVQTTLAVTPGQVLSVYVGGQGSGSGSSASAGGYNGGGGTGGPAGSGGGATDIRIGGTALTDRVVVAGGGGGVQYYDFSFGGAGGAPNGGNGSGSGGGGGATQTGGGNTGGTFGQGGTSTGYNSGNGGGGGGYYGGGAATAGGGVGAQAG